MSQTTFRNITRATSTAYDIENGKHLIPDTRQPGEFKVLHKKPNALMRALYSRRITRMNKQVRRDAWTLLEKTITLAPEHASAVNEAAVFFKRHDCSKLSSTRKRQLSEEYRQHLQVLSEAERRCHGGLTSLELNALNELDALMDKEII